MSVAKKVGPIFEDQVNAIIQRKFDMVFNEKISKKTAFSNESSEASSKRSQNYEVNEMVMERNDGSNNDNNTRAKFKLDMTNQDNASVIHNDETLVNIGKKGQEESSISLDFDMDLIKSKDKTRVGLTQIKIADEENHEGFTLDDSEIGDVDHHDITKKTELFNTGMLKKSNLEGFTPEDINNSHSSVDMMSNEEAQANIESTINDILRPDLEVSTAHSSPNEIEDSELDLGDNTPSKAFDLSEIIESDFVLDDLTPNKEMELLEQENINEFDLKTSIFMQNDATMDFDLSELTAAALAESNSEIDDNEFDAVTKIATLDFAEVLRPIQDTTVVRPVRVAPVAATPSVTESNSQPAQNIRASGEEFARAGINTEDSMRFQATIRSLRQEREEMLLQIKNSKIDSKELEQDNLTLKANLDEAKIEISILRKRHAVEIEDLKYRVSLSEEKKAMAEEKAKHAEARREKLEQKVRIDFNQVKQREKELESKLELLAMDVDSQVNSRDQKILELRRKIDALEFNMENTSIKEQKSHEDKRKLEDRLNKIMKTLRHSIKNLEDDIDHMEDDSDQQKDKY